MEPLSVLLVLMTILAPFRPVCAARAAKSPAQEPRAGAGKGRDQELPRLTALIKTSKGDIGIELLPARAPLAVANFVNLAQRGFYDGLAFDRVIARTAVEGGCPLGKGIGFPGYKFEDEFDPGLRHDGVGVVSLLNAGPDTNGCRFTISLRANPSMDDHNTIFGRVGFGMDAVRGLESGDKIGAIRIEGDVTALLTRLKRRVDEWNAVLDKRFPNLKPAPATAPAADSKAPPASPSKSP